MRTIRTLKDLFHSPVEGFIIKNDKNERLEIISAKYTHLNSKPWQISLRNTKSGEILKDQKTSLYENCEVLALNKNAASRNPKAS